MESQSCEGPDDVTDVPIEGFTVFVVKTQPQHTAQKKLSANEIGLAKRRLINAKSLFPFPAPRRFMPELTQKHPSAAACLNESLMSKSLNQSMLSSCSSALLHETEIVNSPLRAQLERRLLEVTKPTKENSSLLLLHVFNERLLIDNEDEILDETSSRLGPVVDRSTGFTDRYFVVLIEKGANHDSFIMYSIDLSSVPTKHERPFSSISAMNESGFLASPNLPSIVNFFTDNVRVCQKKIDLPEGTRIVSAEPVASYLYSSSLYPACKAPFVILTSCSDDVIRFWKCVRNEKEGGSGAASFDWKEWRMESDSLPSQLEFTEECTGVSEEFSTAAAALSLHEKPRMKGGADPDQPVRSDEGTPESDQTEVVPSHSCKLIDFLEKLGAVCKERAAIEDEYVNQLRTLVEKNMTEEKVDDDRGFTYVTAFNAILRDMDVLAGQHELIAERVKAEYSCLLPFISTKAAAHRTAKKQGLTDLNVMSGDNGSEEPIDTTFDAPLKRLHSPVTPMDMAQRTSDVPEGISHSVSSAGIHNEGKTCYVNAALQVLYHTKILRKAVYEAAIPDEEPQVILEMQRIFYMLSQQGNMIVSAKRLIDALHIDPFVDGDSHEFWRRMITEFEKKKYGGSIRDAMRKYFMGTYEMYNRCTEVDYETRRREPFSDIQLPIRPQRKNGPYASFTITDSFGEFLSQEIMEGDDRIATEEYGLQRALKGIQFVELPPIMMLQLRRFERVGSVSRKVHDRFEYSVHLDLNNLVERNIQGIDYCYKLQSVIVHIGDFSNGHYECYINGDVNAEGGHWCRFDDSRVSRCSVDDAVNKKFGDNFPMSMTASVLIYVRCDSIDEVNREADIPSDIVKRILREEEHLNQRAFPSSEMHKDKTNLDRSSLKTHLYDSFDKIPLDESIVACGGFNHSGRSKRTGEGVEKTRESLSMRESARNSDETLGVTLDDRCEEDGVNVDGNARIGEEIGEEEHDETLHCICNKVSSGQMVECENCARWFHCICVGIPAYRKPTEDEIWYCQECRFRPECIDVIGQWDYGQERKRESRKRKAGGADARGLLMKAEKSSHEEEFEAGKPGDGGVTSSDEEASSEGSTGEKVVVFSSKARAVDIESLMVPAHLQKREEPLDELRGLVRCTRQKIYRAPEERLEDWDEVFDYEVMIRSDITEQAARCMDCGVPFCQGHTGCPLGNIIPKWNDYVFKKNWRQALEQLLQTNNFPEFTGRVCPAPCEGACTLGIGSPAVTIKSIECAIIDYAFLKNWITPLKPVEKTGKRIAVIGSGPSGLACAAQLIKVGHVVDVYEKKNRVGGLLRYGIPTMKLDKFVVDRRVKLLEDEGIRFLTNTEIGKDVPADFLLKENDAIVVCTGSTTPGDLQVEGRDAKGICFAMEYLEKSQKRRAGDNEPWGGLDPKEKKVVILGGGDTATACIGTSMRLGAKSVIAFEILPQPTEGRKADNPWPEWPLIFRTDYGHEEAKTVTGEDTRTCSISTKRFLTAVNTAGIKVLTGLETVEVRWDKDERGAWKLVELVGSEKVYECDLAILAMGFVGPEKKVIEQLTLKTDHQSNIMTAKDKYDSSVAKVFAAGDCRRGQSLVVWAIHEGRQAARQVDAYLMGSTTLAGPGEIVSASYNVHE